MSSINLNEEKGFYLNQLLNNILPFWLKYARDKKFGGYYTCLRRDGSVFIYDKISTWGQSRISWSFGHLYNNFKKEDEWLDMAMYGIEFMKKYGFDKDGRVYGALTRDGKPLAKAFDIYHDLFCAQAFAEGARATEDKKLLEQAKKSTFLIADILNNPKKNTNHYQEFHNTFLPSNKPVSNNGEIIILLENIQLLRQIDKDVKYDEIASSCIEKILSLHYSEKNRAVFELVAKDGSELPRPISRWVRPGHMFECGWFLIHEGQYQNNNELIKKGLNVIEWAMECGWDDKYGGIPQDINIDGESLFPLQFYQAPLKMYWQALEGIYANLLAYCISKKTKFLEHYIKIRNWSFKHFSDDEYGEWYGILDKKGNLIDGGAKATSRKSSQHTVRTFYYCYKTLYREIKDESTTTGDEK